MNYGDISQALYSVRIAISQVPETADWIAALRRGELESLVCRAEQLSKVLAEPEEMRRTA